MTDLSLTCPTCGSFPVRRGIDGGQVIAYACADGHVWATTPAYRLRMQELVATEFMRNRAFLAAGARN